MSQALYVLDGLTRTKLWRRHERGMTLAWSATIPNQILQPGVGMRVQDIMTRDPACVSPDSTAREAAQVMLREEVGLVPVVDSGNRLVGVVTDRDIAIRCVAEGKNGSCSIREVMSSGDLATCNVSDELDSLMSAMRSEKVRRIPIVDERGGLVGIVSQADVVRKARDGASAGQTVGKISEPGGKHAR